MSDVQTFFNMGGYAFYVWPSFLISLVVLAANVFYARAQYRRVLRETGIRAASHAQNKQKKS